MECLVKGNKFDGTVDCVHRLRELSVIFHELRLRMRGMINQHLAFVSPIRALASTQGKTPIHRIISLLPVYLHLLEACQFRSSLLA